MTLPALPAGGDWEYRMVLLAPSDQRDHSCVLRRSWCQIERFCSSGRSVGYVAVFYFGTQIDGFLVSAHLA